MRTTRTRPLLVAALVAAQGCAAWTPAPVAPSTLDGKPREVRVTLFDGRRFAVSFPRIAADTLRGTLPGTPPDSVVLALSDISAIDLPRTDTELAISLSVIGAAVAAVVVMGYHATRYGT